MVDSGTLFDAFIGREAELNHLVDLRVRRARESRGGVVLIDGEAGIGKSRLIAEFERAVAKQRGAFVVARCEQTSSRPYGILLEILRDLNGRPALAGRPAISKAIQALTLASSVVVDDAIEQRQRRIDAVVDAIADSATRIAHLTLVVDDAQWVDLGSLSTLQAAAALVKRVPLLIVVSYRTEEVEEDLARGRAVSALFRDGADRVSLDPLPETQLLPSLRGLLPAATRENLQRIYDLSEGKPYVAEELARSFIDGRARDNVAPTSSLRSAVLERVASLDDAARETLGLAAVLGRMVRYDDLAALGVAKPDLIRAIRSARDLQLVAEIEAETSPAFRFRHSLTQEILYRELPLEDRRTNHRRFAELLELTPGERREEFAYHLARAGETTRSVAAFESVGDRAVDVAAYDDAVRYFEAAAGAALATSDGAGLARIAAKYVEAVKNSGKYDAVVDVLARWREPLRSLGYAKEAFAVDVLALRVLIAYHAHQTASFWDAIRNVVPEGLEPRVRFQFECASYQALLFQHRFSEAAEAIARAEWILRPRTPLDMMDLIVAWSTLAFYWHDNPTQGEEITRQQLRLAEFAGLKRPVAIVTMNLAVFAQQRGDVREGSRYLAKARNMFAALGLKRYLMKIDGMQGVMLTQLGDFETARRMIESAHPDVLGDSEWLVTRSRLQRATGADRRETQALRAALIAAMSENVPLAEILVVDAAWMLDDKAEVRDFLHRIVIEHSDTMTFGDSWLGVAAFGSDEDLAVLLAKPREIADDQVFLQTVSLLFDAMVARRQKRTLAARELALAALPACEKLGAWPIWAFALDLSGDRLGAIAYLRSIGAVAEAARYERSERPAGRSEPVKLTQREEQVGRLAVLGLTSREIAARLNIGARTAENHLKNIYDKLDIHSRAELEAHLA